jgi:hypothetical protein
MDQKEALATVQERSHECGAKAGNAARTRRVRAPRCVLVTLHVEAHVFDVAGLVEAHQALGERFDFVF